ncbi:MAG: U32 family peptidase [Prevotellaceae bacterium]|nr:U32 family peptidase [Prevotellaceae bacterium]
MNKTATAIELLAPARDVAVGKAAIDCGADAVYIAAPRFGAREAAGNAMTDVAQLVRYAHRYYARVYLTLNTILYDNELDAAQALITEACEAGIDAVIVQDMALLEMDLPPVPLFASTQMHNTTPEKVKFLQDAGFRRVILARELSLEQIVQIRAHTAVDLEFFVHGSLCVCYSGQCYLSAALARRSANRGACAQPCRNTYDLLDAAGHTLYKKKRLLSPSDLNLSGSLPALLEAGITSFKIEGRLKNESYVKNVVSYYRRQLDCAMTGGGYKKASSGSAAVLFTPNPERTFSRGFTDYFLHGRNAQITSFHTAKSTGQQAGTVTAAGNGWFSYDGGMELHSADGICFFDENYELCGTRVNAVEAGKVFVQSTRGMHPDALFYRNYDHEFEKLLQKPVKRAIAARLSFIAGNGNIRMTAQDEDGVSVELLASHAFSAADHPEKANLNIKTQLEKSGNSLFDFRVVLLQNEPPCFFPLAALNQWRRELTARLEALREAQRPRRQAIIVRNAAPYPAAAVDYRANIANRLAEKFYIRHGVTSWQRNFERGQQAHAELMRTKYCIKYAIGACKKYGGAKTVKEPLYLLNNGRKLKLTFDCARCQMIIS